MRVIIADDHALVRKGIISLLKDNGKYEVVGEAANGRDALLLAEKKRPDVAILDIAMPELNGIDAAVILKERLPEIKVIILSVHDNDLYLYRAFKSGVCGYVLKSALYEELLLALEAAREGRTYIGTAVSRKIVNGFLDSFTVPSAMKIIEKLSSREREILQLLAEGHPRREIARLLNISPKTVDRHRENLREKLAVVEDSAFREVAKSLGLIGE